VTIKINKAILHLLMQHWLFTSTNGKSSSKYCANTRSSC
jgi:hypothetical protein